LAPMRRGTAPRLVAEGHFLNYPCAGFPLSRESVPMFCVGMIPAARACKRHTLLPALEWKGIWIELLLSGGGKLQGSIAVQAHAHQRARSQTRLLTFGQEDRRHDAHRPQKNGGAGADGGS